jgi:hypothetical protein
MSRKLDYIHDEWSREMSELREIDPALNGPDGELASFIASLIEQNAELAEKLKYIDALTELAEKKIIEASKEAEAIRAVAEREANAKRAIFTEVEGETKAAALDALKENSKADAESEQFLASTRQHGKSSDEISRELCAKLDGDERINITCDVQDEEATQDTLCAESEEDTEESTAHYADFVDMVLLPPISLRGMLKLRRQFNRFSGVKVIAVTGSLDKGLWIRFIVRAPTPLMDVFEVLTGVDGLSYAVTEVGKVYSAQKEPLWKSTVLSVAAKLRTSN